MKITPINLSKTTNFKASNTIVNNSKNKKTEIDTWDKQMFGITCLATSTRGIEHVKNGFLKESNWLGKTHCVFEGVGMTLGLALILMPLWKFLKKINSDN